MACSTVKKVKSGSWSNVFPTDQLTHQRSLFFVKKLLAIAVSNITFLRALFPSHAYGDRSVEGLNLKILKEDTCPNASQLIEWLKGCYDALEKGYLRQMTIGIYPHEGDPETCFQILKCLIESYTFRFAYAGSVSMNILKNDKEMSQVCDRTKRATLSLLHQILVLTNLLTPLPAEVAMVIKILYYDEITPPDYEPPGFTPCNSDIFTFRNNPVNVELGEVDTKFHKLQLRIKTDGTPFEDATISEEDPSNTNNDDKSPSVESNKKLTDKNVKSEESKEKNGKGGKVNGKVNENDIEIADRKRVKKDCGKGVRCACGRNENDGGMILCDVCLYWQHMICFRILKDKDAPKHHVCNYCVGHKDSKGFVTDLTLVNLTPAATQAACIWRRCLLACLDIDCINISGIANRLGISHQIAEGLIERMKREGLVKENTLKKGRNFKIVQKQILDVAIPKYIHLKKINSKSQEPKEKEKVTGLKKKKENKNMEDIDELTKQTKKLHVADPVIQRETRSRKRIHAQNDKSQCFDLAASQETSLGEEKNTPRKKIRASLTTKKIVCI